MGEGGGRAKEAGAVGTGEGGVTVTVSGGRLLNGVKADLMVAIA
jgi:hypothetical protein